MRCWLVPRVRSRARQTRADAASAAAGHRRRAPWASACSESPGCSSSHSSSRRAVTAGRRAPRRSRQRRRTPRRQACDPVAGDELVVLEDDKQLQTVDNIIPAVNAEAATDADARRAERRLGGAGHRQAGRAEQADRPRPQDLAQRRQGVRGVRGSGRGCVRRLRARSSSGRPTSPRARPWPTSTPRCSRPPGSTPASRPSATARSTEPALEKGEIEVMPEYAGTLTEFINKAENGADAEPLASGDLDATVTGADRAGRQGRADVRRARPRRRTRTRSR